MTQSVTWPTRGLAVRPEYPSEPPHFNPMRSLDRGACSRRKPRAFSAKPFRISNPAASSSSASWQLRKAMLSRWKGERACRMPSRELFSQPSPTNSTKEALGFRAMEHSSFWMFSPSSPSWEQPNWWGRAKMPSKEPPTKDWASWASRWQMGFTHPTVGRM